MFPVRNLLRALDTYPLSVSRATFSAPPKFKVDNKLLFTLMTKTRSSSSQLTRSLAFK